MSRVDSKLYTQESAESLERTKAELTVEDPAEPDFAAMLAKGKPLGAEKKPAETQSKHE
jgi:hypothetical protein